MTHLPQSPQTEQNMFLKAYISPTIADQTTKTLQVHTKTTVNQLKSALSDILNRDITDFQLVSAGFVIPDTALLGESGLVQHPEACVLAPLQASVLPEWHPSFLSIIQNLQFHHDPLADQTDFTTHDSQPFRVLKSFIKGLDSIDTPWKPEKSDIALLNWVLQALHNEHLSNLAVKWFPMYGCAMIERLTPYKVVRLSLVCLDNWSFYIHSTPKSRVHSSVPSENATILFVGSIELSQYKKFLEMFHEEFSRATQRTGAKRSSATGSQGHHKTPTFVQAVMIQVLMNLKQPDNNSEILPKGAFTDVGLHTGGSPRNTKWPLFVAVFHHLLDSKRANNLFQRVMIQLPLRLAEQALADFGPIQDKLVSDPKEGAESSRELTNSIMQTLRLVAQKAETFAQLDSFHKEFTLIEARCVRLRHELENAVMRIAKTVSDKYMLPCLPPEKVQYKELTISVPPAIQPSKHAMEKSVDERANENTRFFPLPPSSDCTWGEMLEWMTIFTPECSGDYVMQMVVCNAVESFLFRKMMNVQCVPPGEVEKLMDMYRNVARILQNTDKSKALMRGELLSKEVLVVWIAFCHVHHSTKERYPLIQEYSVSLQPEDLKYLVLSKKEAIDATRQVVRYLRDNSDGQGPIFSGRKIDDVTMDFALRFGNASAEVTRRWEQERLAMENRESQRWEEIQEKKRSLATLDDDLSKLQEELSNAVQEKDALSQNYVPSNYRYKPTKLKAKEREVASLSRAVSEKTAEIRKEEEAPSPIFQPCPSQRDLAIIVLFFLTIPDDLSVLSRLSFLGKQLLLPTEDKIDVPTSPDRQDHVHVDKAINVVQPKTFWREYHDKKSTARTFTSTARNAGVILGSSHSATPDNSWYSRNIRFIFSSNDGVWYPNSLEPILFWNGGGCALDSRSNGQCFNPFLNTSPLMIMYKFTENLRNATGSAVKSPLQWALFQVGENTSPERGNYGFAFQNEMRDELQSKNGLINFCGIRAYPHQQIRRLCSTLANRGLPLSDERVRMLLQQAIYQFGSVSESDAAERMWYTDSSKFDGWSSLREILDDLCEELRSKSREQESIATLGELAAHVSQWDPDCRQVARKLSNIAEKTADDLARNEISSSHENVPIIRARRCILYMSCLVCHSAGDLSLDDVRQVCKSLVMADYTRLFEDPTYLDDKVRKQTTITMCIVAARMPQIYDISRENPQILTEAVKSVHEAAANDISWNFGSNPGDKSCAGVRGNSVDGLVYHINLQTGALLIDGRPPSRLPQSVLSCPLYKRSFKNRNFEVVRNREGWSKTARSIGGCFYEFAESGKAVVIREIDSSRTNSSLELLDSTAITEWGRSIPIRLQTMYSHWLCRKTNTILLRPRYFRDRDVLFVLTLSARDSNVDRSGESFNPSISTTEAHYTCFRIPTHIRTPDWLNLKPCFTKFNRLIYLVDELSKRVLDILGKFENIAGCIHCYKTAEGSYLIDLPRYGLEFELTGSGVFRSTSFSSFFLSRSQNFNGTLLYFSGYLILESGGMKKVLIPAGQVQKEKSAVTIKPFIKGPDNVEATIHYHIYAVHSRFNTIESVSGKLSIEARLQLAALYAATGTMLPEERIGKTGGEHAMELMRQSWKNEPISPEERIHLESIRAFGQLDPALSLLAFEISSSSQILNFLPFNCPATDDIPTDIEASTDYVLQKTRNQLNPRALLTDDEERFLHGEVLATTKASIKSSIEILPVPSAEETMGRIRRELKGMLRSQQGTNKISEFPFDRDSFGDTGIGAMVRSGLRESWNIYSQLPVLSLISGNHDDLANQVQACLVTCANSREKLQNSIQLTLGRVYSSHAASKCFNIRRTANMETHPASGDLLKIHCDMISTDFLNPFLSSNSSEKIRSMISEWMHLCVMEDKLSRIVKEIKCQNTAEVIRELKEVERNWDTGQHPSWLAFEVEQQLQIRDLQYRVVDFCLQNPGKITQLNMGEGKTRVILPMLILELSKRNQLMRIHILSPLLDEAHDYLHHTITASILNRRFFRLPFHRDVNLTPSQADTIASCLKRCRDNGGAMVVAPEHRLSLFLKGNELELQDTASQTIKTLQGIHDISYFDLFDESDEILHHRYQLIYAVGSCIPLSDGRERWIAAQAVLWQLQSDREVGKELQVLATRESRLRDCSLDLIRLHSNLPNRQLQVLAKKLASAVIRDPPYEMRWLKRTGTSEGIKFISFVTEPNKSVDWLLQQVRETRLTETQLKHLLALRGILAVGLLHHCLTLRYRVDYGVDPRRQNRRVAVPYRGSDRPCERAEYAHPDTLILFTHLAYYYRGISKTECKEAVTALLQLGSIAQKEEYSQWIHGVKSLTDETRRLIDDADKLDVTNDTQMTILHNVYQYNMAAISFWLDYCVLPKETMQFPGRISASAFHLTENKMGSVIGFSGTKDNSILLPAQVSQELPDIPEVKATDGKMISLILQNQEVHYLLSSVKLFEAVLCKCIEIGTSALIDAGALMAGLENDEVARRVISLLEENDKKHLQGVVYFDKTELSWMVRSLEGRQWPLGSSPIHERDAFVYFDESHCRGADMKLRDKASALLTVGPDMCKDKLMQAAGRMRKLDRGQRLVFAVPEEIAERISCDDGSTLTSKELLRWVIGNTVKATAKGLVSWGSQGASYCTTQDAKTRLVDEVLDLEDLYSSEVKERPISDIVRSGLESQKQRVAKKKVEITSAGKEIIKQIGQRAEKYGSDQFLIQSTVDEECEREIEHERELEREREVMIPKKKPCSQAKWDFDRLLHDSPSHLSQWGLVTSVTGAVRLSTAMGSRFKLLGVDSILWDKSCVYLTPNFISTVEETNGTDTKDLSHYLRPVDAILFSREGTFCLLLSEWEFDQLLDRIWVFCKENGEENLKIGIANFGLLFPVDGVKKSTKWEMSIPRREVLGRCIHSGASAYTLAALQLFAGHTMFPGEARTKALRDMLPTNEAKLAALKMVRLRGRQNMIPRSDLEDACSLT